MNRIWQDILQLGNGHNPNSLHQSFWNSLDLSDLGGRKSWGPPTTSVMPVPMSAKHFEWRVYFFNGSRKRRLYCKYRNKFGQLRIRNRIEYVIFYLFLVNIIGNCHENKYIWIYCDAQDDLFEWKAPKKLIK